MNRYPSSLYSEILICYQYETRNPTVYGNVILGQMEPTKSSKECKFEQQRDENYI